MKGFIVIAALAAAPAVPAGAARSGPDAQLANLLKGRVAQQPVRCITVSQNETPRIISGRAIVWRVGQRLYVNRLRARAETLNDDDILITEIYGGQLCRNDRVRPLNRGSTIPRAALLLSDFTPYVRVGVK